MFQGHVPSPVLFCSYFRVISCKVDVKWWTVPPYYVIYENVCESNYSHRILSQRIKRRSKCASRTSVPHCIRIITRREFSPVMVSADSHADSHAEWCVGSMYLSCDSRYTLYLPCWTSCSVLQSAPIHHMLQWVVWLATWHTTISVRDTIPFPKDPIRVASWCEELYGLCTCRAISPRCLALPWPRASTNFTTDMPYFAT